jgi:hypothetical protein
MLRWLTIVLARITRRDTSGPPLRVGWNGHPLVDAPEGKRSPDQPAPATAYSTLHCFGPRDGFEPTCAPARPAE